MKKILFLVAFFTFSFTVVINAGSLPTRVGSQALPSLAPMLKQVMPCIVNITVQGDDDTPAMHAKKNRRANAGDGDDAQHFENLGSGVIVDAKKALILTNAHLTEQAKLIKVTLNDGRVYTGKLVGQDAGSDIALIHISAKHLQAVSFADPQQLAVGDFVVAIGSPFGLTQTVTSGVVSALNRNNLGIEGYENFIQTDASINPGNSGGALLNLRGELVGINTAILSSSNGGNIGIGFAIPVDIVQSIMQQLLRYGHVNRGIAGVMLQTLTPELAQAFHSTAEEGALVSQVAPLSPAAQAGLVVGDIIISMNGTPIHNAGQLKMQIGLVRADNPIKLRVLRKKQLEDITLTPTDLKTFEKRSQHADPFFYGLILQNFDADLPPLGTIQGVQILKIKPNTPAWQAGLHAGDVITSIDQLPVINLKTLQQVAAQHTQQSAILLNIYRHHAAAFFVLKAQA